MGIMTHAKFHFNRLTLTLIFGIWASEPPPLPGWRMTEKAGPDRVNQILLTLHKQYLKDDYMKLVIKQYFCSVNL